MKINFFRFLLLICMAFVFSCGPGDSRTEYFDLAEECLISGKIAEASHYYELFLEDENDPEQRYTAWERLLFIHLDLASDVDRGLNILRSMSMEFDQDPERMWSIYSRISDLYLLKNNHQNSLETIRKAMKITRDPETVFRARLKIAEIHYLNTDYHASAQTLVKALDMENIPQDSGRAEASLMLGRVYLQQENFSQAAHYLKKAYDSEIASPSLRSRAGLLLYEAYTAGDEPDKAEQLIHQLKDIHPNPRVMDVMMREMDQQSPEG
ncbi:MAG: tetratricopeptide repeat protein [Desulfonatronovibrionaceae bacterium]